MRLLSFTGFGQITGFGIGRRADRATSYTLLPVVSSLADSAFAFPHLSRYALATSIRAYNDMGMFVLALEVQIRIVNARSLKDKRQIVKSVLEGARRRFAVAAAEVGAHDAWQRGVLGFAVVAANASHAEEVIDSVDRYVWSRLDLEIVSAERTWLE